MLRVINFGAGPAKIPSEVLEEIQKEFINYQNTGISITELSHRSTEYAEINSRAQDNLRKLLNVPKNYQILFAHGGGQGMFSSIPINLITKTGHADYLINGFWSKIAANEAHKFGNINIVSESMDGSIPDPSTWNLNPNASYFYYCDNDTIDGVEFLFVPDTGNVPLVADMSSNILTKEIDVKKYGAIFATSQKIMGTAGACVLIIREDLLGNSASYCPNIWNFENLKKYQSILNTPSVFSIYVMDKIFQWVLAQGGVRAMEAACKVKSQMIYDIINKSHGFYKSRATSTSQSRVNICFKIGEARQELEKQFLEDASKQNMIQLKGHELVGGIRASLYNSITVEETQKLANFMLKFQRENM